MVFKHTSNLNLTYSLFVYFSAGGNLSFLIGTFRWVLIFILYFGWYIILCVFFHFSGSLVTYTVLRTESLYVQIRLTVVYVCQQLSWDQFVVLLQRIKLFPIEPEVKVFTETLYVHHHWVFNGIDGAVSRVKLMIFRFARLTELAEVPAWS
jgi:hypothetical protein